MALIQYLNRLGGVPGSKISPQPISAMRPADSGGLDRLPFRSRHAVANLHKFQRIVRIPTRSGSVTLKPRSHAGLIVFLAFAGSAKRQKGPTHDCAQPSDSLGAEQPRRNDFERQRAWHGPGVRRAEKNRAAEGRESPR
jgi:hypothetical protein